MTDRQVARQKIAPHLLALASADFQLKLHGSVETRLSMIDRKIRLEIDLKNLLRKGVNK